jgi:hypothetical protein
MAAGLARRPATHGKKRGLLSIRQVNNTTLQALHYFMEMLQITLFVCLPQAYRDGRVAPLK